jgi:hypothetical protein
MLANLKSDHAQQVQRIRVIRLDPKDLPVDAFGLLQPTGLVVIDRDLQRLWNRDRLYRRFCRLSLAKFPATFLEFPAASARARIVSTGTGHGGRLTDN